LKEKRQESKRNMIFAGGIALEQTAGWRVLDDLKVFLYI